MSLLKIFACQRGRMLRNQLRSQTWKRWVEISVSLVILIGVEWGGYELFLSAFRFLEGQGEIGQLILTRLFNMGWTVIFILLIISNIITALSTIYRSAEVSYLMSTCLNYRQIFNLKLIDNTLFSSWAIILLGLPLIFSFSTIHALAAWQVTAIIFFILPLFLLLAGISALILLVPLMRLSEFGRLRTSFLLISAVILLLAWLYRNFNQAEVVVAGDVANLRYLGRYISNLSRIPFPFIPSYWLSGIFTALIESRSTEVLLFAGSMLATTLLAWESLRILVDKFYYPGWQILQTRTRYLMTSRQSRGRLFNIRLTQLSPSGALYAKDLIQFIRNPQQWFQFVMFLLLLLIYIVNLSRINYTLRTAEDFWQQLVFILNFGFSGFILASLITRFVYPLISLEGRNRWIILSAPVSIGRILRQKFWLSAVIFFILAEVVALVSSTLLHQSGVQILISAILLLIMSLSLTSLSLGLGAVFPQYHESNPMRIVSGLVGIITILISLFYLGFMIMMMIWGYGMIQQGYSSSGFWGLAILMVIVNIIINYLPLRLGYRALLAANEH